ncbi:MAG: hypothetical protein HFE73_05210 [Firmicutes bacterium]|nr:hypothetical protein [Bacillota bacterium]
MIGVYRQMNQLSLLRGAPYVINDHIAIRQPTIGEIVQYGEQDYLQLVSNLTATSYDLRFQLDDMGFRYEDIEDFTVFCMMSQMMEKKHTSILFGDLDFSKFTVEYDDESQPFLTDKEQAIVIDKIIYELIASYLRQIHGLKRNFKIAGNEMARRFYMQEERRILEEKIKNNTEPFGSLYAPLVTALVNCGESKYTYETIWDLQIYPFMEAIKQTQKLINYKNLMLGIYTGNVDMKGIPKADLTWIGQ